jgi:hypothetical protein
MQRGEASIFKRVERLPLLLEAASLTVRFKQVTSREACHQVLT